MTTILKESIRESHRRKQKRIAGEPPNTTAHVDQVPDGKGSHPIANMYGDNPHDSTYQRRVPVRLGLYVVADPPNDRTLNYTRRFEPTEDTYPAVVEKYTITCQDTVPQWKVTHTVLTEEKRVTDRVTQNIQNVRSLATGFDSFENALSMAKKLAEVRSVSDTLPDELDTEVRENYRELKQ